MKFTDENGRPIMPPTLPSLIDHLRAGGTARVSTTVINRSERKLALVKTDEVTLAMEKDEFDKTAPPATGPRALGPADGRCEACLKKPRYAPSAMGGDKMWWWRNGKWVWRCCK